MKWVLLLLQDAEVERKVKKNLCFHLICSMLSLNLLENKMGFDFFSIFLNSCS